MYIIKKSNWKEHDTLETTKRLTNKLKLSGLMQKINRPMIGMLIIDQLKSIMRIESMKSMESQKMLPMKVKGSRWRKPSF